MPVLAQPTIVCCANIQVLSFVHCNCRPNNSQLHCIATLTISCLVHTWFYSPHTSNRAPRSGSDLQPSNKLSFTENQQRDKRGRRRTAEIGRVSHTLQCSLFASFQIHLVNAKHTETTRVNNTFLINTKAKTPLMADTTDTGSDTSATPHLMPRCLVSPGPSYMYRSGLRSDAVVLQ